MNVYISSTSSTVIVMCLNAYMFVLFLFKFLFVQASNFQSPTSMKTSHLSRFRPIPPSTASTPAPETAPAKITPHHALTYKNKQVTPCTTSHLYFLHYCLGNRKKSLFDDRVLCEMQVPDELNQAQHEHHPRNQPPHWIQHHMPTYILYYMPLPLKISLH